MWTYVGSFENRDGFGLFQLDPHVDSLGGTDPKPNPCWFLGGVGLRVARKIIGCVSVTHGWLAFLKVGPIKWLRCWLPFKTTKRGTWSLHDPLEVGLLGNAPILQGLEGDSRYPPKRRQTHIWVWVKLKPPGDRRF